MSRYKDSSRQGLREGLGCRFVRVDAFSSALRRGSRVGCRVKVQVKVNKHEHMLRYRFYGLRGFVQDPACFCEFWPDTFICLFTSLCTYYDCP